MLRPCLAALAALAFTMAAAAAELPAPLERALAVEPGAGPAPERIALRMSVNDQSILVALHPGMDGPGAATLLQPPSEAALSEEQAEMWAGFQSDDDAAPDGEGESYSISSFDSAALREAVGSSAHLIGEEEGRRLYSFTPQTLVGQNVDEDGLQGLLDALTGEIELDAEHGHVAAVRFSLTAPFKPNFAARIREFTLEQRYVHEPALNGPRFAGMTMNLAGSAVFQPFNQTLSVDLVSVRYGREDGAAPLETPAESP